MVFVSLRLAARCLPLCRNCGCDVSLYPRVIPSGRSSLLLCLLPSASRSSHHERGESGGFLASHYLTLSLGPGIRPLRPRRPSIATVGHSPLANTIAFPLKSQKPARTGTRKAEIPGTYTGTTGTQLFFFTPSGNHIHTRSLIATKDLDKRRLNEELYENTRALTLVVVSRSQPISGVSLSDLSVERTTSRRAARHGTSGRIT
jgi:hypothetical protein